MPFFLAFLLSVIASLSNAQTYGQYPDLSPDEFPLPADMSGVHFYLITVDVGDSVWDNFGHTALRMIDENNNIDLVFNWGVFDISGGPVGFAFKFFKGVMNYQLATTPPAREFANYRFQERTVWQDRINLTNPQKARLYRRLMWNSDESNRVYAYQYYFDNCTTRIRDYLDEALNGELSQTFTGVTEQTFRDQMRTHYASTELVAFSLDVLMNSNIDRQVTEWESMYLPLVFRERMAELISDVVEDGKHLPLLSDQQIVMEYPSPTVEPDAYRIAFIGLLAPVLFVLLMLKRIPMSYFATHSRIGLKLPGVNFRILGLLGLITATFSGVYGMLMLGGWFISDHLDTHHNVNLLLFWPTDLLGIVVGLRWLFLCKPWPMTHNSAPFINYYLSAHVLAMIIYVLVSFFDFTDQSLSNIITSVVPGFFLFTVLIWVVGFQPAKPKNMLFRME